MNELTREQILSMPAGRELDELVQEHVMKKPLLKRAPLLEWPERYIYDRKHNWMSDDHWEWIQLQSHGEWEIYNLRDCSSDIVAAWEVVEKMHKLNWWTVINYQEEEKNAFFYWDPHQKGIDVSAETIPLAICKAALLAVMGL